MSYTKIAPFRRGAEKSRWNPTRQRRLAVEPLEERALLSVGSMLNDALYAPIDSQAETNVAGSPSALLLPAGADSSDTSEYMVGDVWVTVVLPESSGTVDANTENWTTALINQVKAEIQEGLSWWENTFDAATNNSPYEDLKFHIDFTYADTPVLTPYEAISRVSYTNDAQGQALWIDNFLNQVGYNTAASYFTDLDTWNNAQRIAHGTDWAYTLFVVNATNDADGSFTDGKSGYSYVGGPFLTVTTDNGGWGINNLGAIVAHETGHTFYALDEYPNSDSYTDHSGYYNTQNLNAYDGSPNLSNRVTSIMAEAERLLAAYAAHTSSPTSLQMVGWKDSDSDGVFDVHDVSLTLSGTGTYKDSTHTYTFTGTSAVQKLTNQNPFGNNNDITLNTVDQLQYRLNGGAWNAVQTYGTASATISVNIPIVTLGGSQQIEIRTIDTDTMVASSIYSSSFTATSTYTTPTSTTTTITSDIPSSSDYFYGQAITFTATVSNVLAGYPAALGSVQFIIDGSSYGSSVNLVNGVATLTTTTLSATLPSLSAHTISAHYISNNAAFLDSNSATIQRAVRQASLTIMADDQTKVYGAPMPTLTYSATGFVNGDTTAILLPQPILATTATSTSPVGTYVIGINGPTSTTNYTVTYVNGTMTVTKAILTATADDKTMVYGDTRLPTLTATYTGFVGGDTLNTVVLSGANLSTTAVPTSHAGTYTIFIGGATISNNYSIQYVSGTLTITAAKLMISGQNTSMVYGGTVPLLTWTVLGLVNNDTAAIVVTPPTLPTAAATLHVGTYQLQPSGATLIYPNDYTITYTPVTLSVTPASLRIIADDITVTYGTMISTSYHSAGLVNGDTLAGLYDNSAYFYGPVKQEPADSGNIVYSDEPNTPYPHISVDCKRNSFTVGVFPDVLDFGDDGLYGWWPNHSPMPVGSNFYENMILGWMDPFSAYAYSYNAKTNSYKLEAEWAGNRLREKLNENGLMDYIVSYETGTLTVLPATVTVIVDNQTMVYGGAVPTFTAQYSGLVGYDDITDVTGGAPLASFIVPTTTVNSSSHVGRYTIGVPFDSATDHYVVVFRTGTLTINPATVRITPRDQTLEYGHALNQGMSWLDLTGSTYAGGFANNDGFLTLPTLSSTGMNVGTNVIFASGAEVSPDYVIEYGTGKLTVIKATVYVTAIDQTRAYGEALDQTMIDYGGFDPSVLTTLPTLSLDAGVTPHAGYTYAIHVNISAGSSTDNYQLVGVDGVLSVTQANLTVKADNKSKTYGDALPELTIDYNYSKTMASWDTADSIFTTKPTVATTATETSPLGTSYPIYFTSNGTLTAQALADYNVTYLEGSLLVEKAKLYITANSYTNVVYGAALPTFGYTVSGLVGSDTAADVIANGPTFATTGTNFPHVGTYTITCDGAVLTSSGDANYQIEYVSGTLTITKAALTITADSKSKAVGAENPPLTASYAGFVNGDTAANLTTQAVLSTTATTDSPQGTYVITVSGATSSDYTITFVDGVLTVTPSKNAVYLASDPLNPTQQTLYVLASVWDDVVVVNSAGGNNVSVTMNGKSYGTFGVSGRIIVRGFTGNDNISVSSSITRPAWIYGDLGNDVLVGGGGANILFGGNQHDTLRGGVGRNLLLGGYGNDTLTGGTGETMMIGGITNLGANDAALTAIMNEWNSSPTYAVRAAHITGMPGGLNGSWFLNAATVGNDSNMKDTLIGSASILDLFFQSQNDVISGRKSNETLINV